MKINKLLFVLFIFNLLISGAVSAEITTENCKNLIGVWAPDKPSGEKPTTEGASLIFDLVSKIDDLIKADGLIDKMKDEASIKANIEKLNVSLVNGFWGQLLGKRIIIANWVMAKNVVLNNSAMAKEEIDVDAMSHDQLKTIVKEFQIAIRSSVAFVRESKIKTKAEQYS